MHVFWSCADTTLPRPVTYNETVEILVDGVVQCAWVASTSQCCKNPPSALCIFVAPVRVLLHPFISHDQPLSSLSP